MLKPLTDKVPPVRISLHVQPFDAAVKHFAGNGGSKPVYFKAKSDFAMAELTPKAIEILIAGLSRLPVGGVAVILDAYGGAISRKASQDTAFPHRAALFGVQYYTEWAEAVQTDHRMAMMSEFYQSMRPYFSGYAYANYADADLADWGHAYYGNNYERLVAVKSVYDPTNVFDLGPQGIKPSGRSGLLGR